MLNAQDLSILQQISPFRNQRLFNEFLPTGYKLTTLNTVEDKDQVIQLKVILGTLITLYDDYADRPERLNPRLLHMLYRVPFERVEINNVFLSKEEKLSLTLAKLLFTKLLKGLERLKNYNQLFRIFCFDLKQFFLANQYCELLTKQPHLSNVIENRLYLHHNMGIVMAGMIDLMSLTHLNISDLGQARSLFLLGQRAGRISNVLTTFEREQNENDLTNELFAMNRAENFAVNIRLLEQDIGSLLKEMDSHKNIRSFSALYYRQGIASLHNLHLNLKGVI